MTYNLMDANRANVTGVLADGISHDGHQRGLPDGARLDGLRWADSKSSFELVMITLTLPLWTFITLYVLLLLIHCLRRMQYYSVYDKCSSRNAHFRYNFHIVAGRHSQNFNRNENLILDLLDNQMISSMTIQIPGLTIYNDQQMFVYRHSRNNLRCVSFTVYRRHPIKDVKCIRIAHSCSNPDSRVFIYGVDVHDQTNSESKFFPVQSVVKYRGTQWALVTTFEPKSDLNFKRMGLDCYDPFGYSIWPTYLEMLTILLYVWCSSFCFGHLISIRAILNNVPLHALTLLFIVATSAVVISAIYLRMIKTHIQDVHYDSYLWKLVQNTYVILVIAVSVSFWTLALNQSKQSRSESVQWLTSTASCSLILTSLIVLVWIISKIRRAASDRATLVETDANMIRTNSKEALQFVVDPVPSICALFMAGPPKPLADASRVSARMPPSSPTANRNSKASGSGAKRKQEAPVATGAVKAVKTGDDETLDNAYGQGSKYMKTKNRNSIAQYV